MVQPTPTDCTLPRRKDGFLTITEALDHVAGSETGLNFHDMSGTLQDAVSYRVLAEQSRAQALRMLRSGLRAGERLAMVAETDGDFVRTFLACQYAGIIPVPMPLPSAFGGSAAYVAHIRRMSLECGASALIGPRSLAEWLAEAALGLDLKVVGNAGAFDGLPESGDLPPRRPDEIAYLQFSSGSTRFPMGVAVTHRAAMINALAIARDGIGARPGDRAVSWLPFYHDMGLVGLLLTPMAAQVSVDYLPTVAFARRPLLWLSLISRNRGTLSYSPSFGYALCARRAAGALPGDIDLRSWRAAGVGGDMVRPHILAAFAERFAPMGFDPAAFLPSYGLAEATLAVAFAPLGGGVTVDWVDMDRLETTGAATAPDAGNARARPLVLCGRPVPGHEAEIRAETGRVQPERQVGRIFLRGPSLMQGYFNRPDETAKVLSADGWLDTGDLGYWSDGALVVVGRAKDMIIVNGRNVWPQDLEWTAERAEGLRAGDAAAFSVDGDDREGVVLLVQCRTPEAGARMALRRQVRGALLAEHGIEATVVLIPPHSLPQTSSGKLSRSRAKRMYLDGLLAEPNGEDG